MSRIISDILGQPGINFNHTLESWEARSGRNSHDVRLISDIKVRSKAAARQLGFTGVDADSREIYFALQERVRRDDKRFSERLGVVGEDNPEVVLQKVITWLEKQQLFRDVWVLKPSIIKAHLKKQPPKILMKTLGLRSIDSMLKRNSPSELLPLAHSLEKVEWTHKLRQGYKNLKPVDFHVAPVSIHILDSERITKLHKSGFPLTRIVTPCYELGSLVVVPPKSRFQGDVLAIATSLIESISELRKHSAYFRTISVRSDFGSRFLEVCEHGIVHASSKLSHIGWSSLHKHLVGNEEFFNNVEQPHLGYEDLHVASAGDVLSTYDDDFQFWQGLEFVFFVEDGKPPVSMHLIDVITNTANRFDYTNAANAYGQARLWDELWSRYLQHDELAEEITEQFLGTGDQ